MKESISITVWGLDLSVDFYYHKGYAGSLEEPPEPEEIEIDNIAFIRSSDHDTMLEELGMKEDELQQCKVFLAAVEQEIWDSFEYSKEYDYDEHRNDSYFDSEPEVEW